jgi:hypothetical protein
MDLKLKAKIRAELFKCAIEGTFLTYQGFYKRLRPASKMGVFTWISHFDLIAREETSNSYPDITFMVHQAGPKPNYPGQVDFKPMNPKDVQQVNFLRRGTDKLIALYCPGTPNPY